MTKKHVSLLFLISLISLFSPISAQNHSNQYNNYITDEEIPVVVPCSGPDYFSTPDIIRGSGIGESMQQQMARRMAYSNALKDLTSKISTSIDAVFTMFVNDESINLDETLYQKYEGTQQEQIHQTTGYHTICEKYAIYTNNNGRKMYKCYLAIEIDTDDILKPIYGTTQQEGSEELNVEYDLFKEEFNKNFEQNSNL